MSATVEARGTRLALTHEEAREVVQLFEDAVTATVRREADSRPEYVAALSELIDTLTGV